MVVGTFKVPAIKKINQNMLSEHSEEKVYEVCTLSGLSWSVVSLGTGAASYKQLVQ